MPRKRVARRERRPRTGPPSPSPSSSPSSVRERRSKHRAEQRSPPPSSAAPSPPPARSSPPPAAPSPPPARSSPPPAAPSTSRATPSHSTAVSRVVSTGRKVDFGFLERNGFDFGRKIKNLGWEFFCSLNVLTYPNLVREFFLNLKSGSGVIESEVKGVLIVFDYEKLGRILRMRAEGSRIDKLEKRSEGLKFILGREDISDLEEVSANRLSTDMRLLHHITSRIFFPKTGRFDFVAARDISFMYHVIREIPLNLPALMIRYMEDAAGRSRTSLPYGMALTLIFQEHGVDFDGETSRALMHTDTYNEHSLRRMGFEKQGVRWVRRGVLMQAEDPVEAPPVVPAPDFQMEEPAEPTAPAEQTYETTEAPVDRPESSDRSHSRLDEDLLVERVSSRIIAVVSSEIQRLTSEAISVLREEGARLVQEISAARTDASDLPSADVGPSSSPPPDPSS